MLLISAFCLILYVFLSLILDISRRCNLRIEHDTYVYLAQLAPTCWGYLQQEITWIRGILAGTSSSLVWHTLPNVLYFHHLPIVNCKLTNLNEGFPEVLKAVSTKYYTSFPSWPETEVSTYLVSTVSTSYASTSFPRRCIQKHTVRKSNILSKNTYSGNLKFWFKMDFIG